MSSTLRWFPQMDYESARYWVVLAATLEDARRPAEVGIKEQKIVTQRYDIQIRFSKSIIDGASQDTMRIGLKQ